MNQAFSVNEVAELLCDSRDDFRVSFAQVMTKAVEEYEASSARDALYLKSNFVRRCERVFRPLQEQARGLDLVEMSRS